MFSFSDNDLFARRCVWVNGSVIVGAGSSGLAIGANLKEQVIPCVISERSDCITSLWHKKTYDRLKLHLPKQFFQLPKFTFPEQYLSKRQFVEYLEGVESAKYDEVCGLWRVKIDGMREFCGEVIHYKFGSGMEVSLDRSLESEFLSKNDYPKAQFSNKWKGKCGLYTVGFKKRRLAGANSALIRKGQNSAHRIRI